MSQSKSSQGHLQKQNPKYESTHYYNNGNNHRSSRSERGEHINSYSKYDRANAPHSHHRQQNQSKYGPSYKTSKYYRESRSRSNQRYNEYNESRNKEKYNNNYKHRKRSDSLQRPINHQDNNHHHSHHQHHQHRQRKSKTRSNNRNNSNYQKRSSRSYNKNYRKSNSHNNGNYYKSRNQPRFFEIQPEMNHVSKDTREFKYGKFRENSENQHNNNSSEKRSYSNRQNRRRVKKTSSSSEKSLSDYSYQKNRKNQKEQDFIIDPQRAKKLVEDKRIHYRPQNRYLERSYTHRQYSPQRQYRHNQDNYRGNIENHYGSNRHNNKYYDSREREKRRYDKYNSGNRYYQSNSYRNRAGYRSSSRISDNNKPQKSIYINNNKFQDYHNSKYDKYQPNQKNKIHNHNNISSVSSKKSSSQNSQSDKSGSSGSTSSSNSSGASNSDQKDRTKDAGHYKYKKGEVIQGNNYSYELIKKISDGTFGRVFEVKNQQTGQILAMKVIRAVDRYIDSAKTEISIIQKLQKWDKEDKKKIVRLYDTFPMKKTKNYAIVFEKLGPSLFDMIKKNGYKGFSMDRIQSFFKQILEAIGFIHSRELTHTDLKPENILLRYDEIEKVNNMWVPGPRTNNEIKIIDFGGATFSNEHHSSIINTRQYRAPEVILECGKWWEISDTWSIGCIICELITGDLLFQTHESYEHMAMVDKNSGQTPQWMIKQSKLKNEWFDWDEYNKMYIFNWPKNASSKNSQNRVREMKTIQDLFSSWPSLLDLLKKCLTIDPNERISCRDALKHEFFRERFY